MPLPPGTPWPPAPNESTSQYLGADGTWKVPAGSGGGETFGTATIDFGATPTETASVIVTGQAAISAASRVMAWFQRDSTADNGTSEHDQAAAMCPLIVGDLVVGVGFTIYATALLGWATGQFTAHWRYA